MSGELICFFLGFLVGGGLVVAGFLVSDTKRINAINSVYQPSGLPRKRPLVPPRDRPPGAPPR